MSTLTPAQSETPQAVLGAFRALQERIRKIDHERSEATARAAALKSELSNREADSIVNREEFAREEMERLGLNHRQLDELTEAKHQAEINLARNEEQRKAAVAVTENEMNRAEDYKQEAAASEGKLTLLVQRNSHLERELETGKENVARLVNIVGRERTNGNARVLAMRQRLENLELNILNEVDLTKQIDSKCLRQEDFLKSVMSINEALVQGAHQSRESGLMVRDRGDNSHKSSRSSAGGSSARTGSNKKTKRKTKKKKKVPARNVADLSPPHQRPSRGMNLGRNHVRPALSRVKRDASPQCPLPRRRGEGYGGEGPPIRTTNSSRLAAAASKARAEDVALKKSGKHLNIKERIRSANFGPVPFLPAPHTHSFNVLAAVSEAVRCEVGDIEYKVTHHRGGVSVVPSPPRAGQAVLRRGGGSQTLQVSMPCVPVPSFPGTNVADSGEEGAPKEDILEQPQPPPPPQVNRGVGTAQASNQDDDKHATKEQPVHLGSGLKQIPSQLIDLMNSLEEEYENANERYIELLGRATTEAGSIKMSRREDKEMMKSLAANMERKEEQMRLFRSALATPSPPRRPVNDSKYSL